MAQAMFRCLVWNVILLISVARERPDKVAPTRTDPHKTNVGSQTFARPDEAAQNLAREFHALSYPDDCSTTRLLLRDFEPENVEGLGSTLASILNAFAEAYYSNRTLILGPRPAPVFAMDSRVVDESAWCGGGMGFECFFQPLSRCSLSDIHQDEVASLELRQEKRVKLSDTFRGNVLVFTPPRKYRGLKHAREWWVRQLVRYVFRLQPWLQEFVVSSQKQLQDLPRPFVGVHVRHGDLASTDPAGKYVYDDSRRLHPFTEFWSMIEEQRPDARTVVVASDSRDALNEIQQQRVRDPARTYFLLEGNLRTTFGTHFLVYESLIAEYKSNVALDVNGYAVPRDRKERVQVADRMLTEAIVDIMLLSSCEHLVGTGSSAISMWANLLRSPSGEFGVATSAPIWVDKKRLSSGASPVAFLFSVHLEDPVERAQNPGFRWQLVQDRFLDSHLLGYKRAKVDARFDETRGLPWFKYDLLDKELDMFRWNDPAFEIPCDMEPPEAINFGNMLFRHERLGRAAACYMSALSKLSNWPEESENTRYLKSVVSKNLQMLSGREYLHKSCGTSSRSSFAELFSQQCRNQARGQSIDDLL